MLRRLLLGGTFTLITLFALAAPALAGGWAVVTLDNVPIAPPAGTPLTLGFMVRQHGKTPINTVTPTLLATNKETGERVQAQARQEGQVGHFVVEVTFPSAGTWEWEIVPAPFAGTTFEPLVVAPARATTPAATPSVQFIAPALLRWIAALLLASAAILVLARRTVVGRWFVTRWR